MGQKLLLGLLLLTPLAAYPFLRDSNADIPPPYIHPAEQENPLSEQAQIALHCFAGAPGTSVAAALPWEPLRRIAMDQSEELDKLAKDEPVKFLERCLARYEKEVQGYRCVFAKQEKVNGNLRDAEVIRANFREKPFSVHMEWCEGLDLCFASMYVEGENDGKPLKPKEAPVLLARSRLPPLGFKGPILTRPLDGKDVTSTSRFGINRFGMYFGAKDTLDAIHAAQKAGTLHLRHDGIERVEKAGGRLCHKLVRTPYDPPEAKEGINVLTIYIDRATLLQVGSILIDSNGEFVAEYFFKDIEINPTFGEKQFTRKAL